MIFVIEDGWSSDSLHDPLLDQLIEDKIGRSVVLELTPSLCWIVLEGCDLGLELLVEQSQLLLLSEDILAIEGYLLPHDRIAHFVPSFALSSRRAFERVDLRTVATAGCWRLILVETSLCPR